MWNYTKAVHDHFLNPRNVGAIENADAIGEVGSLACGDALRLYLKINDSGKIEDAKFQTFGCASAIASSSALTELVKGKNVDEALKISNKDIADYLGGLPREKMHCSVMGQEALEAAIRNWKGEAPMPEEEGEVVCECFNVKDTTIKRAIIENDLKTLEEIIDFTKAGGACGRCHEDIQQILDETLARMQIATKDVALQEITARPQAEAITKSEKRLSNVQRMQLVLKTLDEDIRPRLQQDGGNIELVDVDGKTVYVTLLKTCSTCPAASLTLKGFIEKTLREKVEEDIVVEEA